MKFFRRPTHANGAKDIGLQTRTGMEIISQREFTVGMSCIVIASMGIGAIIMFALMILGSKYF